MHRRRFLQLSATLVSALLFRKGAEEDYPGKSDAKAVPLCLCTVAGLQYNEGQQLLPRLQPGNLLTLRREPENRHDPLAIAVFAASGHKLGYLPRRLNEIPANLMDKGHPVVARVSEVNPEALPWEAVVMEVGVRG
jgi:hypothetical protein